MKFLPLIIAISLGLCIILPFSCTKDKLVDDFECDNEIVTYESDIKFILETSCGAATTNCHVAGGAWPNYTTFNDDMQITLNNGKFNVRVVNEKNMPPITADPSTELDSIEFYKIRCWVEGGYLKE